MTTKSPLKFHGGKGAFQGQLARWLVGLMPPHTHYVEPFFGGGSVLLAKDPGGVSEAVNDLDGDLITFWRVLQDPGAFGRFLRRAQATPFAEDEWRRAYEVENAFDDVARAWCFFVHCRQSLAGRMNCFAPLSRNRTRRGMNEQASAWLTAVDGLPAVHDRLRRVVILGPRPALQVVAQQDGPRTCFYLDPPNLPETRADGDVYGHEMTEADHRDLLDALADVRGKFVLSGYRSGLYDQFAAARGWNRHEFQIANNAAGGDSKRVMTECAWTNY